MRSPKAFDVLNAELSTACCQLHYAEAPDGVWWASYEADRLNDSAENDIIAFLEVLENLSEAAREQLTQCTTRDFNVGVHCWDTWAYRLPLSPELVAKVGRTGCSISLTLYPMRHPDGTPRIEENDPDG